MKINRLRIHNLTTITDAEIDFTSGPLAEQSIFLITGQTGSGKTSILDAITLALFNEAARFGKKEKEARFEDPLGEFGDQENDVRRLVRRGADKCEIELTFEGNDGDKYTAIWSVKKNKKSGKFGNVDRTLISRNGSIDGITRVDYAIKSVINIDFVQFCRTTMLAQGEFTRFLRSKSDDKSLILGKIIDVDIYAKIGQSIFEKEKEAKTAIDKKEDAQKQLNVMTEEELKTAKDRLSALNTECKALTIKVNELKTKIDWLASIGVAKSKLKRSEQEVAEADRYIKSPEMAKLKADITLWDKTETLRRLIDEKESGQRECDSEIKKAGDMASLFDKCDAALQKAQKTTDELAEKLRRADDELRQSLKAYGEAAPQSKHDAQVARDKAAAEIMHIGRARTTLERLKIATRDLKDKETSVSECEKRLNELSARAEEAKKDKNVKELKAKEAKEKYDAIVEKCGHAAEIIKMLHKGDRCPVCGGTIGDMPSEDEFDGIKAPLAKESQMAKQASDKAAKTYADTYAELAAIQTQLRTESAAMAKAQETHKARCREMASEVTNCGLTTEWDFNNIEALESTLSNMEKECRRKDDALKAICSLFDAKEAALSNINMLRPQFEEAKDKKDKVLAVTPGWKDRQPSTVPTTGESIVAQWSNLLTTVTSWKNRICELKRLTAEKENEIAAELTKQNILDYNAVTSLKSAYTADDVKRARNTCAEAEKRLASALRSQQDANAAVSELEKSKPELAENENATSLSNEAERVKRQTEESNREIGRLEATIKSDAENRKTRDRLTAELSILNAAHEKWEILNSVIGDQKGKNFKKIALSYIFEEILHYANEHLRLLTANRFTLEAQGTLGIAIRDAFHCDAIQTPTNLSGGESFMVSLALALGLASMSRAGNSSCDILFIDEGFGTLDDECLEKVMTMLERLRESGGKRVGIISHVDVLRERIPAQVRVEKVNMSQSRVTVVG